MSVELTITFPAIEDADVAAKQLREAIHTLNRERDKDQPLQVELPGLQYSHPNWERGDACPECGTHNVCVGEITYHKQRSENGTLDPIKPLEFGSYVVSIACNDPDCRIDLYRSPASYLIN